MLDADLEATKRGAVPLIPGILMVKDFPLDTDEFKVDDENSHSEDELLRDVLSFVSALSTLIASNPISGIFSHKSY